MTLLLTCSQVTDRLTDYLEGATTLTLRWRMRTHLSICPGCRAFLRSLTALPGLVRMASASDQKTPPEAATALDRALARLRQDESKEKPHLGRPPNAGAKGWADPGN